MALDHPAGGVPQGPLAPLTRRELMKLMGAGLAVSVLPELAGCGPSKGPEEDVLVAGALWVSVGRRDDLVKLRLGLVGLEIRDATTSTPPAGLTLRGNLYLGRTNGPAYLIVDHPPQHLLEQSFAEPTTDPVNPGTSPSAGQVVQHRIARSSRLTFFVPEALLAIPYELEPILATISTLQLHVADNAYDEPGARRISAPSFGPTGAAAPSLSAGSRIKGALRAARTRQRSLSYQASNAEVSAATQTQPDARNGPVLPTPPTTLSTQLELPFRLIISPNGHAGWEHATLPVISKAGRVELWHTRMVTPEGWMRTIRAIAAREQGFSQFFSTAKVTPEPFASSLTSQDRADLVHMTTNYALKDKNGEPVAKAVDVDRLMLSALGGWLDAHGAWNLADQGPTLALWDHRAVMGRDQKVQVANYGYLYPFGHMAILVRVTERKFQPGFEDSAYLWSHQFIVVKEPLKTYEGAGTPMGRAFPFTSVRFKTLITPALDADETLKNLGLSKYSIWALQHGNPFPFEVEAFDHDGNAHTFTTACMFLEAIDVADHFPPKGSFDGTIATEWETAGGSTWRVSPMKSQRVALAPSDTLDDTSHSTRSMAHTAVSLLGLTPFGPQLAKAELALDAARAMTGVDVGTTFSYIKSYIDDGFDALDSVTPKNIAGVFMGLTTSGDETAKLLLSQASDKSGGFASPDLVISGLSRVQGLLSGQSGPASLLGLAPQIDPSDFFKAVGAKLFGILPLSKLIDLVGGAGALKQAPKFVSQVLDAAELVFHTFENAGHLIDDLKARLLGAFKEVVDAFPNPPASADPFVQQITARVMAKAAALGVTPAQLKAEFAALNSALDGLGAAAVGLAGNLEKVASIDSSTDLGALTDTIIADITKARDALSTLGATLKSLVLPIDEGIKAQVLGIYDSIVVKLLPSPSALADFKLAVKAFVNAEEAIKDQHVTLDWSPTISGFPGPPDFPSGSEIFWPNDKNGFRVGVDLRAKASGGHQAGASVFASLTDFELRLIGKNEFIKLVFDKLVFKAGTDGKATVDVGFRGLHFAGPLTFIETIRQFIPLDGFSDPPALQVSPQGISPSFSLPLPNVAIGVFSLENLSLSAGFTIPFVGKALSVSFAFCSRESPFVLTVCMLGGGGFVGLTLGPDGVRLLEISLEAQACLAVDFGVASGSVGIALGIYFAVEADDCRLSGYLRIHGVVQVLGIIHASIQLNLELNYESSTKKVVGRASLEIEVSVFCFSASVTIETERKFSGGNSDPTFRQVMAYDLPSGYAPWDEYCGAFSLVTP